jgi:hypothetical protein
MTWDEAMQEARHRQTTYGGRYLVYGERWPVANRWHYYVKELPWHWKWMLS